MVLIAHIETRNIMARKLLWVSVFSLHDTSSGAAIQARTMLECLAAEGVEVTVLNSFVFDSPSGADAVFPNLEENIKKFKGQQTTFTDQGITYHYTFCFNRYLNNFTHDESWRFFIAFSTLCNSFRPDIIMGYGVGTTGVAIQAESRRRGIPFVYSLHNGNHPFYDFNDCDLLLTESQATADLYAKRDRLNVQATGIFIKKEKYIAQNREPKYVTFINPHPSKGVSIFAKLALKVKHEMPNVEFLVVESRGMLSESLAQLHLPNSSENPYVPNMFSNVNLVKHTSNMKEVYRVTKVLLVPSLWYESWGRVVTEAVLNNIPCIVSESGGLKEAMGSGGIAVAAPHICQQDHLCIPTDEEIQPWFDALKRVLSEDFNEQCKKAAEQYDIQKSTKRIMEILEPLFARKASYNPRIIQNGILRMQVDGSFK